MKELVIETNGLSRDYGRFRALDKVNLSIEKERIVALLGPNGAGKTTLLHLLMGMLEPTEGQALILGVNSRAPDNRTVGKIGYMGDGDEPPRWMTVRQLINLQEGSSGQFDKAFINELLSYRQLSLNKAFASMSKGQKKWLRAGLVLASRPNILILDEPAEGLDTSARYDLYDYLRDYITESGATAIVATHIIGDIERIADDVAIIHEGHVITYACLEDLREQVCEIYLPGDTLPPLIECRIELIGKKPTTDGTLFWARCKTISEDELRSSLEPKATVRHVDLQTFYMATTKTSLGKETE
ncbi:MAG: ABC transporter ATP-binding protein [Planctomycetota bacterium]|jgi:ABC-2 type transport system ATP-binding protein